MLTFHILTIFPELFEPFANESLLAKARQKKLLSIKAHNLRDWAEKKPAPQLTSFARGNSSARGRIDDKPFGGGLGMVMKIEPVYKAIQSLKTKNYKLKTTVILFTPRGKKFTQQTAARLSKYNQIIFICPRYEGADERIAKHIADEEISIGDFVLMGGEVPAMTVIETVSRLIPGVVGKPEFLKERQAKNKGFWEYPQYTRPEIFTPAKSSKSWRVPKVLVSGDHKKIGEWKAKHGKLIGKSL